MSTIIHHIQLSANDIERLRATADEHSQRQRISLDMLTREGFYIHIDDEGLLGIDFAGIRAKGAR